MRLPAFILMLALLPTTLAAQEALTPDTFDAYATGKTLYYGTGGAVYGAEQYLPGHRVIWAFAGEPCKRGSWYPSGNQVCFVYESDPDTHCWTFYDTGAGLRAQFESDPDSTPLVEVDQSPDPLFCPGPDVGV